MVGSPSVECCKAATSGRGTGDAEILPSATTGRGFSIEISKRADDFHAGACNNGFQGSQFHPVVEESHGAVAKQGANAAAVLAAHLVLADAAADAGPLAGLCTLLTHAGDRWSLLLACDMPLVTPALLDALVRQTGPTVDAAVFGRDDPIRPYHSCCALYHPRLLQAVREELIGGRGRVRAVFEHASVTVLHPTPEQNRQLTQVNTPEEYARLHPHR